MSNRNEAYPETGTISLIDLVAVLVRYRRMIVGGTILAVAVAAVFLYALPAVTGNQPFESSYQNTARIALRDLSPELSPYLSINTLGIVRDALESPEIVGEAYREMEESVGKEIDPERTEAQFLGMMARGIIGNRLTVGWNEQSRILTVQYTGSTREEARILMSSLLELVDEHVANFVTPRVDSGMDAIERRIRGARVTLSGTIASGLSDWSNGSSAISEERVISFLEANADNALEQLVDLIGVRDELETIKQDTGELYTIVGRPLIVEQPPETGRRVVATVIVLTALFFLLVAAFVRQYADNVRHDEVEMIKLRSAWQGRNFVSREQRD